MPQTVDPFFSTEITNHLFQKNKKQENFGQGKIKYIFFLLITILLNNTFNASLLGKIPLMILLLENLK